jgi:hypothetical protein
MRRVLVMWLMELCYGPFRFEALTLHHAGKKNDHLEPKNQSLEPELIAIVHVWYHSLYSGSVHGSITARIHWLWPIAMYRRVRADDCWVRQWKSDYRHTMRPHLLTCADLLLVFFVFIFVENWMRMDSSSAQRTWACCAIEPIRLVRLPQWRFGYLSPSNLKCW